MSSAAGRPQKKRDARRGTSERAVVALPRRPGVAVLEVADETASGKEVTAAARLERRRAAVDRLEAPGLGTIGRSEGMAARSETGAVSLGDLLDARPGLPEAQIQRVDLLRAPAAGIDLRPPRRLAVSHRRISPIIALLALGSACRDTEPPSSEPSLRAAPAAPASAEDWCQGHGLPESMCTKCHPELIEELKARGDWCEAHGFPESACPICQPSSPPRGAANAEWCLEHGLPESKCTKCNPELEEQFRAAGDFCEAHGFPESACPICQPQEAPKGVAEAALEARVVRLWRSALEGVAGIQTAAAERGPTSSFVTCTSRIAFDADRVADVRALVPGVVRKIRAKLGAAVAEGDPLFELESTRVGEIQGVLEKTRERIRAAEAHLARLRELRGERMASIRQVEVAERELASAKAEARTAAATLRMAGASRTAPSGRYTLRAPIAGTVVRRPAVIGRLATAESSLATIADTSVMWALCDVPEAEASRIEVGQRVTVAVEGGPPFEGRVTWIAAEVDPRRRTVAARAEIPNPEGRLRGNQFARARIETKAIEAMVLVPRSALQRVEDREVVFVCTDPGVYEPRVVRRLGDGDPVGVEGRVAPGDRVVTTGAVLLRTEVMPGSIGAGCCELEPRRAE